jgi:Holliday junction DNA helicase RuvB
MKPTEPYLTQLLSTTMAVQVETLAALTAEERGTIEDFYEPYLMQVGLIERTPRGRKVTPKAYKHLGHKLKSNEKKQSSLL